MTWAKDRDLCIKEISSSFTSIRKGRSELYNLREDIGETRDLSGDQPEMTRGLLNLLKNWKQQVGAGFKGT